MPPSFSHEFQFPRSSTFNNDPILLKFDMNVQLTDTSGFYSRFFFAVYFLKNDLVNEKEPDEIPNLKSVDNGIENVVTKKRQRKTALPCKNRVYS